MSDLFNSNFSKRMVDKSGTAIHSIVNDLARYPGFIYTFFYIFSAYLVLPLVDIPLLGLSISAPLMFVIAVACFLKPPAPWFKRYQSWIFLAIFFWLGIFISTMANGLLSFGIRIDSDGYKILIQYVYWLIVFVVTAYFASQGSVLEKVARILGWSVMILGIFRLVEVSLFGNLGASKGAVFLTPNNYGVLFSMFSPYLLIFLVGKRKRRSFFAVLGYFLLLGAVAINGSRGSWISIAVGLAVGLITLMVSRPRKFMGLFLAVSVVLIGFVAVWYLVPQVSTAVGQRYSTLSSLEEDKSFLFRELMIQKGLKIFKANPILGIGSGRFTKTTVSLDLPRIYSSGGNKSIFTTHSAHNSYIVILSENGLLAAIPFALILLNLLFRGFSSTLRSIRRDDYLPLAVFLSFVQMSIHFWVIAALTNTSTWFVYGIMAAVIMLEKNRAKACV